MREEFIATGEAKEKVVEMSDVNFSYNGTPVLRDVTFAVERGDFLSIVGPNAGGKTTLLKLILALLKPSSGSIAVFGESPVMARSRIGYMPQTASLDLQFPVTVNDVVLMGRLGGTGSWGIFGGEDRRAAEEALRRVEMQDFRNRAFSDLSGGQRQRVLIARALVSGPELLLLDEPTSNIDVAVETEFFELLKELNSRMTIVLVTHDLGFVSKYVGRVACVNQKVFIHPTSSISGEMINELYGADVKMVRHDGNLMTRMCNV
ncbi:MAG: ABC transporter ATP-binding protein [Deltaproteobacteria bacterium]|nr:ABC transporter ATP-binding protein [Deltaproteobacteria bacterium]